MIEALRNKTVGIAGCGGLGSNCAAALARSGVGTLVLADFDIVSHANLNRQYFFLDQVGMKKVGALAGNLRRIDPGIRLRLHDVKLNPARVTGIFAACQVIIEAFDVADAKQMIIETVLTSMPETWLIAGMGLAGWGGNDTLVTRREGRLILCGDGRNEVSESLPPLAPRVGIVAHMQANAALEILLGKCPGMK